MSATGIDLGTTFSAIGYVNLEGVAALYPDAHDANLFRTPSIVHIGADACFVGSAVEEMLEDEPDLPVVRFSKLALGSPAPLYTDPLGRDWNPEAINALILRKLKRDAEVHSYQDLTHAVVTVPAQFGDAQRRATRRACALANLPLAALIDEPVAAATYLGIQQQAEQTILVYDLGGGTFDATVLHCSADEISVLATDGDNKLGGKWIDELIMQLILGELERLHGRQGSQSSSVALQARRLAEDTKLKLCKPGRTQVRQTTLLANVPFEFVLTLHHFQALVAPLIERTLDVTERCLASAGLTWNDVHQILLVGGSTLIPAVRESLQQRSKKPAETIHCRQPHQAVAFGAALLASQFAAAPSARRLPRLRNAISAYDLGVRVRDPRTGALGIYKMVKRNTALPAKASKIFFTSRDDQNRLVIEVVQSKGDAASALSLGHFSFGPIENPRKQYPIELTLSYDEEGIVHVSATDSTNGQVMQRTLSEAALHPSMDVSSTDADLVASVRINA